MVTGEIKQETPLVEGLNDYEMIVIYRPEIVEDALKNSITELTQMLTEKGGIVSKIDEWGKKRLAYPIKHAMEGTYILATFKLDPTATREIENSLKVSEKVLRHLLIRLDQ